MEKFWQVSNWEALCRMCHDVKTAKEDGGFGNPIKERDSDVLL
jgi:5-methylcytosine-specific restriction protein A